MSNRYVLSEEEKALFRKEVDKLPADEKSPSKKISPTPPTAFYLTSSTLMPLTGSSPVSYTQSPLSKQTMQQLKRGERWMAEFL